MSTPAASTKGEPQGGAKLLIDIGPLLVFFAVNFLAPVPPALKVTAKKIGRAHV